MDRRARGVTWLAALAGVAACSGGDPGWQVVHQDLPGALISVWGSGADDIWSVGGDPGDGPMVLHYDGQQWTRLATGASGDLWWVFGFAGGPVFMGGSGGLILRYQDGAFTTMTTPGSDTVFGIWGANPDDVWAVGGALGGARGAFAWKRDGDSWVAASGFPAGLVDSAVIWKVYGRSAGDAWMVGTNGTVVRWDGSQLSADVTGTGESLFTVHGDAERYAAVGGFGTGTILENDGSGWVDASPADASPLIGVCLTGGSSGWAVGQYGAVYRRDDGGWTADDGAPLLDESLHAVWVDPDGGVWAVGGNVLTTPLTRGVMVHRGDPVSAEVIE